MVMEQIAQAILSIRSDFVTRIAIDGVDGAGKTMFAQECAPADRATVVVDNNELAAPRILRRP